VGPPCGLRHMLVADLPDRSARDCLPMISWVAPGLSI
jgi:hypothetical protein